MKRPRKVLPSATKLGKFYRGGLSGKRLLFRLPSETVYGQKVFRHVGKLSIPVVVIEANVMEYPDENIGTVNYYASPRVYGSPGEAAQDPTPGQLLHFPPWGEEMTAVMIDVKQWNTAIEHQNKQTDGKPRFPFLDVNTGRLRFLGFIELTPEK